MLATPTRSLSAHVTQSPALTVTTSRSIAPLTVPKNSEDQLVGLCEGGLASVIDADRGDSGVASDPKVLSFLLI